MTNFRTPPSVESETRMTALFESDRESEGPTVKERASYPYPNDLPIYSVPWSFGCRLTDHGYLINGLDTSKFSYVTHSLGGNRQGSTIHKTPLTYLIMDSIMFDVCVSF